jgi:hypothetical protein
MMTWEIYGPNECSICGRGNPSYVIETFDTKINPKSKYRDPISICQGCIVYVTKPGGLLDEMIEQGQEKMPINLGENEER